MATPQWRHGVVACLYGLLDVLRGPLARFVAEANPSRASGGVHAQLRGLLDALVSQFPADVQRDMELLARVETQLFHEGYVDDSTHDVERAVRAVLRLLETFAGDDHDVQRDAQALCALLNGEVGADEAPPPNEDREEETVGAISDGDLEWELDVSCVIPVEDEHVDDHGQVGGDDGGPVGVETTPQATRESSQRLAVTSIIDEDVIDTTSGSGNCEYESEEQPACFVALGEPSGAGSLGAAEDGESKSIVSSISNGDSNRLDAVGVADSDEEGERDPNNRQDNGGDQLNASEEMGEVGEDQSHDASDDLSDLEETKADLTASQTVFYLSPSVEQPVVEQQEKTSDVTDLENGVIKTDSAANDHTTANLNDDGGAKADSETPETSECEHQSEHVPPLDEANHVKSEHVDLPTVTLQDCFRKAGECQASGQLQQAVEWCSRGLTLFTYDDSSSDGDAIALLTLLGEATSGLVISRAH